MFYIGCHLSISNGYQAIAKEALSIGANVFQFFSRNPRGGKAKALNLKDIEAYKKFASENGFGPPLAHAPYTLNCASPKEDLQAFARMAMSEDLERLELIPNAMYNFHPGAHGGQGAQKGIELICNILRDVIKEGQSAALLLETMAGKGTEIGGSFEELAMIIKEMDSSPNIGVCMDTCHVYDAGYDIKENLDGVLSAFDEAVGLERLKAIHLNDSKNPIGSKKDRHEKIGEGSLGLPFFKKIINHPELKGLPFFLETPNEIPGYAEEIRTLKDLYEGGI